MRLLFIFLCSKNVSSTRHFIFLALFEDEGGRLDLFINLEWPKVHFIYKIIKFVSEFMRNINKSFGCVASEFVRNINKLFGCVAICFFNSN